jgi:hypothetical protein
VKSYLLSLPERLVRSVLGVTAGVAREVGEVAFPPAVRRSQLYQNLVDTTLRFLIEQVGGAEGVYASGDRIPDNFVVRRTAGNAIEVLGIVAFRASPVWVLAAMADVCGMGRYLIPEIADALEAQGLLEKDAEFTSIDQMLDGLERTSSRLAATVNTPPLDVEGLRKEWDAIRAEAQRVPPAELPTRDTIARIWTALKTESVRQERSVFETSSMLALAAVRAGAVRTSQILGATLLDHYSQTLREMQQVGYLTFAARQFQPYARAAVDQFSPSRKTLTQRMLEKLGRSRNEAPR